MVRLLHAARLVPVRALAALVALTLASCVSAPRCPSPHGSSEAAGSEIEIAPGDYALVMTATRGPERGASVRGTLHLAAPDPAIDYRAEILLTGSMEIDFDAVAAPILADDTPAPDSTDPWSPGVLVVPDVDSDFEVDVAGPGTVLLVGTSSNLYPVRARIEGDPDGAEIIHLVTDGAGIGLRIERAQPGCFCGRWDRWGILGSGSGRYCARRLPDGASPASG